MPPLSLTPLPTLRLSAHLIPSHDHLPNTTPHSHPLLIYHSAFHAPSQNPPTNNDLASKIEAHLTSNALTPQWRHTMYTRTHYHSTTHEVLCVYRGAARLLFGGETNPARVEVEVGVGDCVVVPAGVGHRLLEDFQNKDEGGGGEPFGMVGAYPDGCEWDMCYGGEAETEERERVGTVKWFERDVLYGADGPCLWGWERLKEVAAKGRE
ncbi:hypothetical protein DM02DRAFT_91746 [Periconia macrospinosa]|uniref:Uncharacterized protein n=1 Tax=Periconia macrospinosa TaxID=97972 RepID=A0A2V1DG53_9PLEO|nr:hypothetical protein DM02DRAFT_91746 [Periconia macrospinosa]